MNGASCMTRVRALVTLSSGICLSLPAMALTMPKPCSVDVHVQCATYEPGAVYQVTTQLGRAVLVELEAGEKVVENGTGIGGEPGAWQAAMNERGLLLQPSGPQVDTNLVVVSDRRVYVFALQRAKKSEPTTWLLRFDYPDTRARELAQRHAEAARRAGELQAKVAAAAADRAAAVARAESRDAGDATPKAGSARNEAFLMRGDKALAPSAVWDDGRFTYFRYRAGDLPRVFQLLDDGSEALTNFHMAGDTIVVHAVARGFVIRLGSAVLGIRNDGYAPGPFNADATGPSVGGVKRVLKRVTDGAGQ